MQHPSRPGFRQTALLAVGIVLIAAAPVVGVLPGPGGIVLFALGLALVLRQSHRARCRFARAKRRWPRLGALADRALWRGSSARRRARDRAIAR